MSWPQAEQLKNRGSFPERDKEYFAHPKLSGRSWCPPSVLFNGVCLNIVYGDKFVFSESLFVVSSNDPIFQNCK